MGCVIHSSATKTNVTIDNANCSLSDRLFAGVSCCILHRAEGRARSERTRHNE